MLTIRLLGRPSVQRDGRPLPTPRGAKAWGLAAYLLLRETPPSRHALTALLFPDAEDPAGALRWNLSQLRRLLGDGATVEGDPVTITLPAGSEVDVWALSGTWAQVRDLPGLEQPLLEGMRFPDSPGFELWLEAERRHVRGVVEDLLREAALAALVRGDPSTARALAQRLVDLAPLDENAHVVLVRSLAASGDPAAAEEQARRATVLLRRELGVEPTDALRQAARRVTATSVGPATVRAHLEAGRAAVGAGVVDAGLTILRDAAVAARRVEDRTLTATVLLELGIALVHAARGTSEEGAEALIEAGELGLEVGLAEVAATAHRELAYIDVRRARYDRARHELRRARALAPPGTTEIAWIAAVEGMLHTDVADYDRARVVLTDGIDQAERIGDSRALAYCASHLGRLHVLLGELEAADAVLQRSVATAHALGWNSFVPWPESFLGEVALLRGDLDAAAERFEHAFALGCQLGDPCWESVGVRGLGLLAAARGDVDAAVDLLDEAPRRCQRLPDAYLWVEAYGLDALCDLATTQELPGAVRWVERLDRLVSHRGMRELRARAAVYRMRLGQPGSAEFASTLVSGIDNPRLAALIA